jgi:predicted ATPase
VVEGRLTEAGLMATDLESETDPGEVETPRPSIKITGLHIRGLKSIGSLDLPGDGLGWDGPIPDMVMMGGINGSGKTTLLNFLAVAFEQLENHSSNFPNSIPIPPALRVDEARIDFFFPGAGPNYRAIRFLVGDPDFIDHNTDANWFGLSRTARLVDGDWAIRCGTLPPAFISIVQSSKWISPSRDGFGPPHLVYFPSERRTLISPPTNHKFAGKLSGQLNFVDRWEPPEKWDNSLEARLYGIRWEDLNAKEEGRNLEANGFEVYSQAFDRFFEGRKKLKWHRGELVVETKSGDIHDLSELSSGEKQVILFMGELLHRWRPGSLILIDEPELHLHQSYQTRLWESLVDWQKERGGQVIVATQSGHLFKIADSAMKVLLSRQSR